MPRIALTTAYQKVAITATLTSVTIQNESSKNVIEVIIGADASPPVANTDIGILLCPREIKTISGITAGTTDVFARKMNSSEEVNLRYDESMVVAS